MTTTNYGQWVKHVLLAFIWLFVAVSVTHAKSGYLSTWSGLYPGSASDNNAGCQLCHGASTGNINSYGYALAQCAGNSGTITERIQAAENLNSDGDSGGSTNLEEIIANAQPGWTTGSMRVWDRTSCSSAGTNTAPSGIGLLDPELPPTCNDKDGDGYGNPGDASCKYSAEDCDDSIASINPGAVEDCTDGIDNDCDSLVDSDDPSAVNCPASCTDLDSDGYNIEGVAAGCGPIDCDDDNGLVNPGESENCTDGIDNDCDELIDVDDPDCPAENCSAYNGNRTRCKADLRCEYSGKEKTCSEIDLRLLDCKETGGRWSKRLGECIYR